MILLYCLLLSACIVSFTSRPRTYIFTPSVFNCDSIYSNSSKRVSTRSEITSYKDVIDGDLRELTTLSDDTPSNVAWSPSDKKIVFNDSAHEVYTIWPDGSHRTAISDGDSQAAVWSPGGTKLAFIEDGGISLSGPDGTIMQVYPRSDGQITYLTWLPDSFNLAFITSEDGTSRLCILQLATGSMKPILQTSNRLQLLNWQRE